jgi:hypothetical protein
VRIGWPILGIATIVLQWNLLFGSRWTSCQKDYIWRLRRNCPGSWRKGGRCLPAADSWRRDGQRFLVQENVLGAAPVVVDWPAAGGK